MDKPLFSLITLKEAEDFIDSLAPAVVRKIFFNIDKVAEVSKILNYSRSSEILKSGNSGQYGREWLIDCLRFGIKTKTLLL